MKKKKEFTLAVILLIMIILAVGAYKVTPFVLKMVENSKKDDFQKNVELLINETSSDIKQKTFEEEYIYTVNDGNVSDLNSSLKKMKGLNGNIIYDHRGNVSYAIENGKWCIKKTNGMKKQKITKFEGTCSLSTPLSCFTYQTISDGEIEITDYNDKCDKDAIIPSTIEEKPVTSIGSFAFSDNQLTSVEIPNSVTYIGNGAFSDNQLTSIVIPDSVTSIENSVFEHNKLTSVIIPNSVTRIGSLAFYDNQLTSIEITDSVMDIGSGAFNNNQLSDDKAFIYVRKTDGTEDKSKIVSYGGAKRDNIEIPNSVADIGYGAFSDNQLTSVEIPNSVASIGDFAFSDNQLTSVEIPNSVTDIGYGAFKNNQLTSIVIPDSVTSIENSVFEHNKLTSVEIPNSVESIGFNAFADNQLTSVEIPNSVTYIGYGAFKNNQLTSVEIPNSVMDIGSGAFNNNQLTDDKAFIYARKTDGTEDKSKIVSYGGAKRDNIEIPNSVTDIGNGAFSDNQLTSVEILNSVKKIGFKAFADNQLTSVTIGENVDWIGIGAFIKDDNSNPLTNGIINKSGNSFDWGPIVNGTSGYNFVTGMIFSSYGNVEVRAN